MKRIFLLLDDYVELTFLETILKKVGFDTVGYQGILHASDKALEILPDLMILADKIKDASTHEALMQIKKMRPQVRCLLLRRDFSQPLLHDLKLIDLTLKSPIDPIDFLKHVCRILQIEGDSIAEKFAKLGLFRGPELEKYIKIQSSQLPEVEKNTPRDLTKTPTEQPISMDRESRYESVLKEVPQPKVQGISHKVAIRETQEFRSRSKDVEIQKIDEERKNFVKALFKKD